MNFSVSGVNCYLFVFMQIASTTIIYDVHPSNLLHHRFLRNHHNSLRRNLHNHHNLTHGMDRLLYWKNNCSFQNMYMNFLNKLMNCLMDMQNFCGCCISHSLQVLHDCILDIYRCGLNNNCFRLLFFQYRVFLSRYVYCSKNCLTLLYLNIHIHYR